MKFRFLLWAALTAGVISFTIYSYTTIPKLTYGFAAYYTSSRMVLEGDDLSKSYNFDYFNSKLKKYGFTDIQDMPNNLPTTSLVMLPIAWMSVGSAKITWGVFSVLLFFLSVLILLKIYALKLSTKAGLFFILICFFFYPVYRNIALGQLYILLLFLFSVSIYYLKQNKNIPSAFIAALAFMFKGYGALISIWYLFQKKWRLLFSFAGFAAAVFIISIAVLGFESWKAYLNIVPSALINNPASSVTAYQNVNGFMKHLFVFDGQWSPHPVISLSIVTVSIITLIITLCIIYFFLIKRSVSCGKKDLTLLSYAAVLGVSVITAPLAEEYHYVLFLPLVAGLVKLLFDDLKNLKELSAVHIVFILSVVIMAAPFNYVSLQNANFPVYLLAYPKLYAGAAILAVYLYSRRKLHPVSALN